jgi:hypothetical protein
MKTVARFFWLGAFGLPSALHKPVQECTDADEHHACIEYGMTTEVHEALIAHRSQKAEGLSAKDTGYTQQH